MSTNCRPAASANADRSKSDLDGRPSDPTAVAGGNRLPTIIEASFPTAAWSDVNVVVAVSGGADSVGLLRAMVTLRRSADRPTSRLEDRPKGRLIVAHLNHGLRGTESDGDEAFVRHLSADHELPFETERLSDPPSDEAGLATRREAFLTRIAAATGSRYVATGHHADDNAETLIHHLIRGTGPAGLAGIPVFRPAGDVVLARPMIHATRDDVRDYLRCINQSFREDRTNADASLTRNWIRHDLLRPIEDRHPGAGRRIADAARSIADWRAIVESVADRWLDAATGADEWDGVDSSGATVRLTIDVELSDALAVEIVRRLWQRRSLPRRDMTSDHYRRVAAMIRGRGEAAASMPGGVEVRRGTDRIVVTRSSRRG